MKRLAVAASVVLLLAAPRATPAEPFAPLDGQFRVQFPGKPKENTANVGSGIGKLKVFTATYSDDAGNVFMVSYTDFPEGAAEGDNGEAILDGARAGLKGKDGDVLADEPRGLGRRKIDGREVIVKKGNQHVRVWLALRGDRLFQVGVIGTPEFVKSKEATAFLASFDLTK